MQVIVRLRSPKALPTEMVLPTDHHPHKAAEAAE
jgi:hypothetical protein